MRTIRSARLLGTAAVAATLALTAAACGGDDSPAPAQSKGKLTVGSAEFPENQIIANMYSQALKKAGYEVTEKFKIGSREVYIKSIERGEIDIVPEYLGTLTEYYNAEFNGPDAPLKKPLASGDPAKTYAAAKELVARRQLAILPYSKAADQKAFAVIKEFADQNGLSKVSDLAKLNGQLVLGAGPECDRRPACLLGLQSVYGLRFKEVKKLDNGGDKTFGAFKDGSIDVGLVFSSDGAVAAENLVVLEDDKQLQQAENIAALVRQSVPQEARDVVSKVDQALTTEKLQELNKKFRVEKADPEDLAEQFLKDAGLL